MSPAALLLVAVGATAAWSWQDPVAPRPLVLTITYADGRAVPHLITTRWSGAWTPMFPKNRDWRSPEGLSVTAVNYKHRIEGPGVRVNVSVFLGQPRQKELSVASVVVAPDERVRIDALSEFGVAPVVLSIGEFVPTTLYHPQFENKTAALQVESVDILTDDAPGYRITVRNLSSKPVMTFHVESYEGRQRRGMGRQGHRDGTPAARPGETFSFRIDADRTRDLIRITGLMFEDGTIEGDAGGVAIARVVYAGRRQQLQRVLELFGPASRTPIADPAATIVSLASRIEAFGVLSDEKSREWGAHLLPPDGPFTSVAEIDGAFSAGLEEVRSGVLSDLRSAPRDASFERWLKEITALYSRWYLRFIELTR